ncbi:hypothetical protein [Deinococcus yunweiensis]|uniref:hypothetical protein n=1 Tax=Deinococcus yunweiensis TaxID=367282 RepID=UPI00398F74EE
MTPTEFEHWQAGLPTGCDELTALLTTLQEAWVHAQAALIPATRLGNGYPMQDVVSTLSQQIRVVEARLLE